MFDFITKWGNFFVLQSEASDIKTVIITKKGSTIYLVTEKLSSRILEAGFLLQLYWRKNHTPPQTYLRHL